MQEKEEEEAGGGWGETISETTDYFMTVVMDWMRWSFLMWWKVNENIYEKWNTEFSNSDLWTCKYSISNFI